MPTNAQVLAQGLGEFDCLDYEVQETIANYIDCPGSDDCTIPGKIEYNYICTECKIRWLNQEWEG